MNPDELIYSPASGGQQIIDRSFPEMSSMVQVRQRFKPGHPTGFVESLANLYEDFYLALSSPSHLEFNSQEIYSIKHSLEFINVCDAMVRSHSSMRWESVSCN